MRIWNILSPLISAGLTTIILWFWKPWVGAYAGEKGKTLARKEDLDAILAEVRAVTIAQKEIESNLSGDLWHRQTRWNEKKDIYTQLIDIVDKIGDGFASLPTIIEHHDEAKGVGHPRVLITGVVPVRSEEH